MSIAVPGPNDRIGKALFRGTGREASVGSVGVVGLGGVEPRPRPVISCVVVKRLMGFLKGQSRVLVKDVFVGTLKGPLTLKQGFLRVLQKGGGYIAYSTTSTNKCKQVSRLSVRNRVR